MATDLRPADLAAVYRTEPLTAVTTLVEDLLDEPGHRAGRAGRVTRAGPGARR
jgi:hypothetical protein